jgi:hypothetical protein
VARFLSGSCDYAMVVEECGMIINLGQVLISLAVVAVVFVILIGLTVALVKYVWRVITSG